MSLISRLEASSTSAQVEGEMGEQTGQSMPRAGATSHVRVGGAFSLRGQRWRQVQERTFLVVSDDGLGDRLPDGCAQIQGSGQTHGSEGPDKAAACTEARPGAREAARREGSARRREAVSAAAQPTGVWTAHRQAGAEGTLCPSPVSRCTRSALCRCAL